MASFFNPLPLEDGVFESRRNFIRRNTFLWSQKLVVKFAPRYEECAGYFSQGFNVRDHIQMSESDVQSRSLHLKELKKCNDCLSITYVFK